MWIEQLAGRLAPPVPSRVGGRLPAHVTAAGKVLLASAPAAVDALCAAGLDRHGPGTITDPARLRAELATIAERGVAINREESRDGVLGVAAPVFGRGDAAGRRVGAGRRATLAVKPGSDGAGRAHGGAGAQPRRAAERTVRYG